MADNVLRIPHREYRKTNGFGVVFGVVHLDAGKSTNRHPAYQNRQRLILFSLHHCGLMHTSIWSWEEWFTTSQSVRRSLVSKLGDLLSYLCSLISCKSPDIRSHGQRNTANELPSSFLIQAAGASMASGNNLTQAQIFRGKATACTISSEHTS